MQILSIFLFLYIIAIGGFPRRTFEALSPLLYEKYHRVGLA